jgi:hypothetical protein
VDEGHGIGIEEHKHSKDRAKSTYVEASIKRKADTEANGQNGKSILKKRAKTSRFQFSTLTSALSTSNLNFEQFSQTSKSSKAFEADSLPKMRSAITPRDMQNQNPTSTALSTP